MSSSHQAQIQSILLATGACSLAVLAYWYCQHHVQTKEEPTSTPSPPVPQITNDTVSSVSTSSLQHVSKVGHPLPCCEEYNHCVYLDYNATTPIFQEVYEAMIPYLTKCFGNPSSAHKYAVPCKQALQQARKHIAQLIHASHPQEEVVFTSCGTECDNRAIDLALAHYRELAYVNKEALPRIITCKIEHPAVICYLRILKLQGVIDLVVVPVDKEGFVNMEELEKSLTINTALVTIMHSNNEVGTLQPIRAISQVISNYNQRNKTHILFHTDAAQSLGKVFVDVEALGVDLLTVVGHKFGAPKGVGALYIKKGLKCPPMLVGGGQENGMRAGTENVPYAVALGEAARIVSLEQNELLIHMMTMKLRLLQKLQDAFGKEVMNGKIRFNGPQRSCNIRYLNDDLKMLKVLLKQSQHHSHRHSLSQFHIEQLPNTISISFQGLYGHELVAKLGETVACSAGSACHAAPVDGHSSQKHVMSDVLMFMGVEESFGLGTLRLSCGRHSTAEEMDRAAQEIYRVVSEMWNSNAK